MWAPMYSVAYTGFVKLVGWKGFDNNPLDVIMCAGVRTDVYTSAHLVFFSYLVWIQREVCVQQLPGVVIGLALIDLVGGVSNLHIHGPVGHPLVLEALGPVQNMNGTVI